MIYRLPLVNQQEVWLFIEELTAYPEELHIDDYNSVALGDFNLGQMLEPYIDLFKDILTRLAFNQSSNYCAHVYGGILDLVFRNRKQTP